MAEKVRAILQEDKTVWGFFLGTKDLLSGRRAQAKREGIQERSEHGRSFQKA